MMAVEKALLLKVKKKQKILRGVCRRWSVEENCFSRARLVRAFSFSGAGARRVFGFADRAFNSRTRCGDACVS
jgi:hypothetical protein